MGIYNSSLTRVRPFFKELLKRDPSGKTWLPSLLALAEHPAILVEADLLTNPGTLLPTDLDNEPRLSPPEAFLCWLIQNPDKMSWPEKGRKRYGPETQLWREKLMGTRDLAALPLAEHPRIKEQDRAEAMAEALRQLAVCGASGSGRKWWAFEGRTAVDCYLATDRLRIYIEGKRTDILSPTTDWYPLRNQLMRNIESASQDAAGVPFVCVVMAENKLPARATSHEMMRNSWHHLAQKDRESLMRHFLGTITWRDACKVTDVDYDKLPDTV
jgi:hypothetical protein